MEGLTSSSKKKIFEYVDSLFDNLSEFVTGKTPKNKKQIIFKTRPTQNIVDLFLKNLEPQGNLLPKEEEALKNLLSTADEYIESLKSKTKVELSETIDAYIKKKRLLNQRPSTVEIKQHISEVMTKAKSHFVKIAESEGTKAKNLGSLFKIAKVGASIGVSDPNVIFITSKDSSVCSECVRLHLMPDLVTPRVWKMSELEFGYHKKGNSKPSVNGAHPHCKCQLTILSPGFGFNSSGRVAFISLNHDEYKKQRG